MTPGAASTMARAANSAGASPAHAWESTVHNTTVPYPAAATSLRTLSSMSPKGGRTYGRVLRFDRW